MEYNPYQGKYGFALTWGKIIYPTRIIKHSTRNGTSIEERLEYHTKIWSNIPCGTFMAYCDTQNRVEWPSIFMNMREDGVLMFNYLDRDWIGCYNPNDIYIGVLIGVTFSMYKGKSMLANSSQVDFSVYI